MRLRFALYMSVAGKHVLTGWKEIAVYLQRGVRTVQRWEVESGLPIRRPAGNGSDRAAVIAIVNELDQWLKSRPLRAGHAKSNGAQHRTAEPRAECRKLIEKSYQLQNQIWQSSLELAAASEQLRNNVAKLASQRREFRAHQEVPLTPPRAHSGIQRLISPQLALLTL
jgi:hypothetical protein